MNHPVHDISRGPKLIYYNLALVVATIFWMFLCAHPAHAATFDWCADQVTVVTSSMDVGIPDTTASPDAHDLAFSAKMYNSEVKSVKPGCKPSNPKAMFNFSLLTAWQAWLHHWEGKDPDGVEIEKAIQVLTVCTSNYFGTDEGATCERWQERFIHMKTDWESATP